MLFSRRLLVVVSLAAAALLAPPATAAADDAVRLREEFPAGYQYHVSTRVELTGSLSLPAENAKAPPRNLAITGSSAIDYDERVLEVSSAGEVRKKDGAAVEFVPLTVSPRSPFDPVVASDATVVAAPNVAPWSVDLRTVIFSGDPPLNMNT